MDEMNIAPTMDFPKYFNTNIQEGAVVPAAKSGTTYYKQMFSL